MQSPPFPHYLVPPRSKYSPQHHVLSFLSSHNVNDQVSHPYKTKGKIIVLYILIFKFQQRTTQLLHATASLYLQLQRLYCSAVASHLPNTSNRHIWHTSVMCREERWSGRPSDRTSTTQKISHWVHYEQHCCNKPVFHFAKKCPVLPRQAHQKNVWWHQLAF